MGYPPGALCLLLFFLASAYADKCHTGCHGMQTSKSYQEGHTYIYDFEGSSVTSVTDAEGEANLKLKATVELHVKPDCIKQVWLKGVQLNGSPVHSADVEQFGLQFNYHDGHIDSEVCATPGDSQASLNIKRAVVSLLQSAVMQDSGSTTHHETDVFGSCPTHFTFHKDGDNLVVQKSRNLNHCSHRENLNHGLLSGSPYATSEVHTTPLLASHQRVEQRFRRGVLSKAASTESYDFKPFSSNDAGARTIVETTLTLKGDKPTDGASTPCTLPKSLIFESPHLTAASSAEELEAALKSAKAEVSPEVRPEAAAKFSELAKVLKRSSKEDILAVYRKVRAGAGFDKVADQRLFLDALFKARTGEAIEVAVEILKEKELQPNQALTFYANLPLVLHVNLPSVLAITSLLEQPDLPRMGYLGVGQIVGKYCQEHKCDNVPEIKEAVQKIREKVGNGRTKSREQENQIITALKALGNTRYLDDATLQKLANIASDKNVRNRVRVAAIEALPTRCSMKWKTPLLKVMGDLEEDSEVRIKAYLSLVSCPCPEVANHLKEVLDKEPINQFGSFVSSHLRNLRASTSPEKQEAKRQLGLLKSKTRFPEDIRKFSFNQELSYSIDAYGLGSSIESNVIYSQNSFVPRSVDLNLTAELFGRSFNFLEMNTRVENLDRVIERYLGPKGQLRDQEVEDMALEGKDKLSNLAEIFKGRLEKVKRHRREVKQGELDRFAKNVKLRHTEVDQELDLDLSIKLFGVELAYLSYQADCNKISGMHLLDKLFDFLEVGMEKLKSFDHDFKNHLEFLDAELVYPSGLGLPLTLGATGTSVVKVKTSGTIDVSAILKDPTNAAFKLSLTPSLSVRLDGRILLRGFGVESGMKLVGTLYSSTGTDLSVALLDGKGFDVTVGTPLKKDVIVSFNSDVLFSSGPKGDRYVAPKFGKSKEYSDCFDQLSSILGVTVCGEVSFPYDSVESIRKRPLFPLSGPAKFGLTWENVDLKSYHFKAKYDDEKPRFRSLEILFETPGSKVDRKMSLVLEGSFDQEKYLKLSLNSPIKKASLEASLKDDPKEKTVMVKALNDGTEYFARAGLLANGNKYKPVLEYKVPDHIEKLAGTKTGVKNGHHAGQHYNMQGTVDVTDHEGGKKYHFDKLALVSGHRKLLSLDGFLVSSPDVLSADLNFGYPEENVVLKFDGKRNGERDYAWKLSAMPSKDPNLGFGLDWVYKRTEHDFKHKLIFVHGPDPNSETNRLTLDQEATYKLDPKDVQLSSSNELTYPALNLLMKLSGKLTKKSVEGDFEFKYEKFKLGTELSAKVNTQKPGDYEVEFEAELLENSLELKSKRTILDNGHKSKLKNSLVLKPGGKYEADAVIVYDVRNKENLNLQLDGDLNLNGKKLKIDTGLETNPQSIHSRAVVTLEGTKYIDFVMKLRKGNNPNGNVHLNLKNYMDVAGQYSFQNGKGSGQLTVDVPRIHRKLKATGDVTISGTQHVGNLELLYDADKDPSKKIKLSMDTDWNQGALDMKSILEVLENKLECNVKGKFVGTFQNGEQDLHVEFLLPNGRFLEYNLDRAVEKKDGKLKGHVKNEILDHESKGGKFRKFVYTAEMLDLDPRSWTFKHKASLKFVDLNGQDVDLGWNVKSLLPEEKKRSIDAAAKLAGSKIHKPVNVDLTFEGDDNDSKSSFKASLGDDLSIQTSGSLEHGDEDKKPWKLDAVFDGKFPSAVLKNLQIKLSESLLHSKEHPANFEYTSSGSLTYNDNHNVALGCEVKHGGGLEAGQPITGYGQVALKILQLEPMSLVGSYSLDESESSKKALGKLEVLYGQKETKVNGQVSYLPDLSEVTMDLKANTPFEKMHNLDLNLVHKTEKEGKHCMTDVTVTTDSGKYTLKGENQMDENVNMFHALVTCPAGKAEVLSKFEKLGHNKYAGEWKVDTSKGFVTANAEINIEDADNFVLTGNFDSDKVKYRKIHAEITNKPTAKVGKRLIVTITSDNKNLVSGSTSYKRREEEGKTVVEGNGSLRIGENVRSSSFKYTKQQLTHETDGEVGIAMLLNANFGPSAVVGEFKFTSKETHIFNSYCEQNKDCAHFKLQYGLDTDHKTQLKHRLTLELDLKKFNVPVEFGLKTNTELKDVHFDHAANLYLHSSKDKSEYTYQLYMHPKESGIVLSLPSREVALIGTFDLPKTRQTGAYKMDISFYLDRKNKPSDKTSLMASGDFNAAKNSLSLSGEAKLVYPSQPKDMIVKGRLHYGGEHLLDLNVDVDVFAKKSQKITIQGRVERQELLQGGNFTSVIEINSRGQQLKLELKDHVAFSSNEIGIGSMFSYTDQHQKPKTVGFLFSLNAKQALLLIAGPNKDLLRATTDMVFSKELQKMTTEVQILGNQPLVMDFEARDLNSFYYVQYSKENPNHKFATNGRVVLGQLAEIHADVYENGAKKKLLQFLVHLDEGKFLKPVFEYNKENILASMEHRRAKTIEFLKQLKSAAVEVAEEVQTELKDLLEHLRKAQPNVKPLIDYYQTELQKMKHELHADQAVKEIQATLNKHFGAIITVLTETTKKLAEQLKDLQKQLDEMVSKLTEAFKVIYPKLKESFDKIFHALTEILDAGLNLGLTYLKAFLNLLNAHQKELKEILEVGSELGHDVAKILMKATGQLRHDLEEFLNLLVNQAKALPVYEILKEKYHELNQFQIPETVLHSLQDLCNVVKAILPTEELRELLGVTCEYVLKHAKHESVDDGAELKKVYSKAVAAIQSVITLLESQVTLDSFMDLLQTRMPIDLGFLSYLPGVASLKLSIVNLIKNNELQTPLEMYYAYRPTLHLTDVVPPFSKTGTVVDGGNIVTFDGRHLNLPGSCNYILAQDMLDGNFSVVAQFNNGNLQSVTLTEPKESITIKADGSILVNNKPTDFPCHTSNLHAYLSRPFTNIKSNYGVHVTCSDHAPMICTVRVSGFYLGKLRGLLGDGNNEPYDDFTLPSGQVAKSATEFGNAYKLKSSCPAVNAVEEQAPRSPVCTEYFSGNASPMKNCFNFVNPTEYRNACDQKATVEHGPCLIAAAYYAACYEKRVSGISLPSDCLSCKVGDKKIAVGDSFSVKTPKKEADVIFVVEQDVKNEKIFKDLVTPLMADLREELKHHGITDVYVGLIGFGEKMKWPQHYTLGGNVNIDGEVKNIKFQEKDPIVSFQEAKEGDLEKRISYLGQRLDVELGTFKLTDAYEAAIRYPFRPGAARAVVGVIASPCEKSPFPISLQQLRLLVGQKIYRDLGLTYYHISFPNELLAYGKPQKNVVGYDQDSAYTFADSKKRPLGGNAELKNNLISSASDVCADFAVSSGGATFSANNFLEAKPNQKKQFAQVAARKIAEGLADLELEQDCTCEEQGLVARARCTVISRREKETLAKHTKGGTKG
ncbi:hypothetical protein KM043_008028 [Ampulex compressa]|nr:hypothetical protein KM043_008028 [Ampulex compressa]